MFQNVSDKSIYENANEIRENRINLFFKELFKPRNCIIYILTYLISSVKINNGIIPFGLALVGACMGSTIPVFMVYIVSLISIAITHGGIIYSNYFNISLIFFLLIFMFKPKVSTNDRNEIFKIGTRLFFASFIYYIIKNIKGEFSVSNIFLGFIISLITYVFYKIFVNGITVIRDFPKKEVFTTEELTAVSIILSIAFLVFKKIVIFEYSISDILTIFLIIYIGIKNGIGIGAINGLAVGICLILFNNIEIKQIAIFIISGITAGIFGYIIMPGKLKRKNLKSDNLLENIGEHRLNYYEEIKEKINAVTQTISELNANFFIKNNNNKSDEFNKEIYVDNFLNLLDEYKDNIFYEDIVNNQNLIIEFFENLEKEDIIVERQMIDIFKKYNNYILLQDQKIKNDLQEIIKIANRVYRELQINSVKLKIKKEEAKKLENELNNVNNIIKSITDDNKIDEKNLDKEKEILTLLKGKNYPIKNVKINIFENGKYIVKLNFQNLNNEIREKNKISNIENLISRSLNNKISFQKDKKDLSTEEYCQIYTSEDKYLLQVGCTRISKEGSGKVSGDSSLQVRLTDGKYLLAISDGMGSGEKARKASKFVINSINNLLSKGFDENKTIKLINSELNFNKDSDMYASLDMCILDLYKGEILLSKNGACNTYIKNKKSVKIYSGNSLPIGVVEDAGLSIHNVKVDDGDIILMCSDGLIDVDNEVKENWIEEFLKNVNTNNVQKIADLIVNEAIDNSLGIPKDDITVIIAKILKKK